MERRRLGYAVLGLVALIVVALAASTLSAPVEDTGGETGVGEQREDPATSTGITPPRFDFFMYFVFGLLVLMAAAATYGLLRQPIEALRGMAQVIVAGILAVGWVLLLWFLMEDGAESPGTPPGGEPANESTGGSGTGTGEGEGVGGGAQEAIERLTDSPELLLLGVLGVLTLGVIAVVVLRGDPAGDDDSFGSEPREQDTLAAIGSVAGEAADRLEADAAVENEIYRAYKRMTELLDVDSPDVRTPGEFRQAAVAAGMDAEDVDELVDTFEAVRYGGHDPTADREQRAIDALRGIEETYGDAGGADAAGTDGEGWP
ncbi:hypothetical protein BRC81_09260 [Halobacteriales archaeon QS_1_68_20]|nr:MAG: hypothetical protein BRC81_09260 [Halobacteriales archaeon QS_1_68_20]